MSWFCQTLHLVLEYWWVLSTNTVDSSIIIDYLKIVVEWYLSATLSFWDWVLVQITIIDWLIGWISIYWLIGWTSIYWLIILIIIIDWLYRSSHYWWYRYYIIEWPVLSITWYSILSIYFISIIFVNWIFTKGNIEY